MSKMVAISPDVKWILDEILRIQAIHEEAVGREDQILARLHSYDLTRLWERLNITTCEICYHGREMINPMQECRWWNRCRSYLKAGEIANTDGMLATKVSLIFEIE